MEHKEFIPKVQEYFHDKIKKGILPEPISVSKTKGFSYRKMFIPDLIYDGLDFTHTEQSTHYAWGLEQYIIFQVNQPTNFEKYLKILTFTFGKQKLIEVPNAPLQDDDEPPKQHWSEWSGYLKLKTFGSGYIIRTDFNEISSVSSVNQRLFLNAAERPVKVDDKIDSALEKIIKQISPYTIKPL